MPLWMLGIEIGKVWVQGLVVPVFSFSGSTDRSPKAAPGAPSLQFSKRSR